jgi:hypothetical protein
VRRGVAANNSARASHAAIAQSDDGNLAMTWRGGLDHPAGDHGGRGKICAKQPDEAAGEVLVHAYALRDAPTPGAARPATDLFINTVAGSTRRPSSASPTT